MNCRIAMGQEDSVLKSQEESTTSPTPSSSSLPTFSAPPPAVVSPDLDTATATVPDRVSSSTEDAPATLETLEEEFQNLELEVNNQEDNGDKNDELKEDNPEGSPLVKKEGKPRKFVYPQRPDVADCAYYLRTGTCRYGVNCRYNHPARKKNKGQRSASLESAQVIREKEKADLSEKTEQQECKVIKVKEKADLSENSEQQECKYYLRSGGCKFGKACRYNHSREKFLLPPPPLDYNFLGLPIRPRERECPYYMRTGSCKYGPNCRFHHPDPTAVGGADTTPDFVFLHPSGASQPASTSWSSPSNETVPFVDVSPPYVPMMFPPQGLHSNHEWNGYQASACPPERSMLPLPSVALNNPTNRADISMHNQQHMLDEFPERPGQPECSYFMKTGDCIYRSACKYNHPKNRVPKGSGYALSAMGLPLRPVG